MPRQARLDAPGTLHHVMIRGIERTDIVGDDADREFFVDRMGNLSVEMETPIYAWALMTNHAHILLKSGSAGLSSFMRRLLTGYAIIFNQRYKRHGHLFQNRYKSIVCEEDAYFKELVRYIHLNPLRAGIADSYSKLHWYKWSGHSIIMGRRKNSWQDTDYVLGWFGSKQREAKQNYREYVRKGIELGKQPHLVGGGLIRSMGGWSQVKALRRIGEREESDDRILGGGDFVKKITQEIDLAKKYRLTSIDREQKVKALISSYCRKSNISVEALKNGSRLRKAGKLRKELSIIFVEKYGLSMAEASRQLGVTTSAIAKIFSRRD